MKRARGIMAGIGILMLLALIFPSPVPALEQGDTFYIAIPTEVLILDTSLVIVTGRPTSTSPVNCAPGTPWPLSAVIVDPGGGYGAQSSGVLIFTFSEEVPPGTRLKITAGPTTCNTDFRLYTGVVE